MSRCTIIIVVCLLCLRFLLDLCLRLKVKVEQSASRQGLMNWLHPPISRLHCTTHSSTIEIHPCFMNTTRRNREDTDKGIIGLIQLCWDRRTVEDIIAACEASGHWTICRATRIGLVRVSLRGAERLLFLVRLYGVRCDCRRLTDGKSYQYI